MSLFNSTKKTEETVTGNLASQSDISNTSLEVGLWYVRHRKNLYIGVIVMLGLLGGLSVGYSLYKFSHYLLVGRDQDAQLYRDLSAGSLSVPVKINPEEYITISETSILLQKNNQADLVAKIESSHTRSVINFSYYFMVGGEKSEEASSFILPGDNKYVMIFNQPVTGTPSGAQIVIENIRFSPVDRQILSEWEVYRQSRLDFSVEDKKFTPGQTSGLSEKINLGELSFTISNQGGYSYRQVPLAIVLRSGSRIASISRYYVDNFRSGEIRSIRVSWPESWSGINQIEVLPDVDILDQSIFLQYISE
jgi:hypothetical protein